MAIYDQLPVFKASYDLLLEIFKTVKNLTKDYKYSLGENLKSETIALMLGIYKANSQQQKKQVIQEAREHTEVVRIYIRLLFDLKQITLNRFVFMNEKIELVSKQLSGWQKSNIM